MICTVCGGRVQVKGYVQSIEVRRSIEGDRWDPTGAVVVAAAAAGTCAAWASDASCAVRDDQTGRSFVHTPCT